MSQFVMPKLGADMTRGKLVEWCKKPGEPVKRGDIIAVIETDKANVDTESFVDGVFERVLVEPHDEWLPVGTPLAVIHVDGEVPGEAAPQPAPAPLPGVAAPAVVAPSSSAPPAVSAAAVEAALARLRISPAARKHALDLGIDPAKLVGTGPGGRITLADVERAAAKPPPTAAEVPDKAQRMRDAIAATMSLSKREIPHYYLSTVISLAKALAWLGKRNADRAVTERVLPGVLLLKATALALRSVPELNGFWRNGRAEPSRPIHVGVAISLRGGGLVAPAVHDADQCDLDELMRRLQDLTKRARAGSLKSSEMTDPTITVTSLGERGVDAVYGIIYPPQLALVGFGKVVERPWIVDGRVVAQPVVYATLSGDHRATDGHRGALLLDAIDRLLQEPEKL
ncbi:MAG TPA: dihydrolipoamide acetyltransferase family protein [Casimicrobiaceae bacterium]|nr:dihydrolipoamide acetyltransferase family protein [Casimicrobiaceae bacterium]